MKRLFSYSDIIESILISELSQFIPEDTDVWLKNDK